MEFNWEAEDYRALINDHLGYRKERRPRGAVKALATQLRCHSTFVAQVLKGRAEFSPEQGLEICRHFGFSGEQQEFFLTLLAHDRAGTHELKNYYQKKLSALLEARRDLNPKLEKKNKLESFESEYFGNWIYQAVHALTQIAQVQTLAALAKTLKFSTEEINNVLVRLETMELVKYEKGSWKSTENFLHLSKNSQFIRSLHTTWKTKLLADLQTESALSGTRYSGVVVISEKDHLKVRDVLARAIGSVRKIAESSSSEKAYVLSVDCYEV